MESNKHAGQEKATKQNFIILKAQRTMRSSVESDEEEKLEFDTQSNIYANDSLSSISLKESESSPPQRRADLLKTEDNRGHRKKDRISCDFQQKPSHIKQVIRRSLGNSLKHLFQASKEPEEESKQVEKQAPQLEDCVMSRVSWVNYLKVLFDQIQSMPQSSSQSSQVTHSHCIPATHFLEGLRKVKQILPLKTKIEYYEKQDSWELGISLGDVMRSLRSFEGGSLSWDDVIEVLVRKPGEDDKLAQEGNALESQPLQPVDTQGTEDVPELDETKEEGKEDGEGEGEVEEKEETPKRKEEKTTTTTRDNNFYLSFADSIMQIMPHRSYQAERYVHLYQERGSNLVGLPQLRESLPQKSCPQQDDVCEVQDSSSDSSSFEGRRKESAEDVSQRTGTFKSALRNEVGASSPEPEQLVATEGGEQEMMLSSEKFIPCVQNESVQSIQFVVLTEAKLEESTHFSSMQSVQKAKQDSTQKISPPFPVGQVVTSQGSTVSQSSINKGNSFAEKEEPEFEMLKVKAPWQKSKISQVQESPKRTQHQKHFSQIGGQFDIKHFSHQKQSNADLKRTITFSSPSSQIQNQTHCQGGGEWINEYYCQVEEEDSRREEEEAHPKRRKVWNYSMAHQYAPPQQQRQNFSLLSSTHSSKCSVDSKASSKGNSCQFKVTKILRQEEALKAVLEEEEEKLSWKGSSLASPAKAKSQISAEQKALNTLQFLTESDGLFSQKDSEFNSPNHQSLPVKGSARELISKHQHNLTGSLKQKPGKPLLGERKQQPQQRDKKTSLHKTTFQSPQKSFFKKMSVENQESVYKLEKIKGKKKSLESDMHLQKRNKVVDQESSKKLLQKKSQKVGSWEVRFSSPKAPPKPREAQIEDKISKLNLLSQKKSLLPPRNLQERPAVPLVHIKQAEKIRQPVLSDGEISDECVDIPTSTVNSFVPQDTTPDESMLQAKKFIGECFQYSNLISTTSLQKSQECQPSCSRDCPQESDDDSGYCSPVCEENNDLRRVEQRRLH